MDDSLKRDVGLSFFSGIDKLVTTMQEEFSLIHERLDDLSDRVVALEAAVHGGPPHLSLDDRKKAHNPSERTASSTTTTTRTPGKKEKKGKKKTKKKKKKTPRKASAPSMSVRDSPDPRTTTNSSKRSSKTASYINSRKNGDTSLDETDPLVSPRAHRYQNNADPPKYSPRDGPSSNSTASSFSTTKSMVIRRRKPSGGSKRGSKGSRKGSKRGSKGAQLLHRLSTGRVSSGGSSTADSFDFESIMVDMDEAQSSDESIDVRSVSDDDAYDEDCDDDIYPPVMAFTEHEQPSVAELSTRIIQYQNNNRPIEGIRIGHSSRPFDPSYVQFIAEEISCTIDANALKELYFDTLVICDSTLYSAMSLLVKNCPNLRALWLQVSVRLAPHGGGSYFSLDDKDGHNVLLNVFDPLEDMLTRIKLDAPEYFSQSTLPVVWYNTERPLLKHVPNLAFDTMVSIGFRGDMVALFGCIFTITFTNPHQTLFVVKLGVCGWVIEEVEWGRTFAKNLTAIMKKRKEGRMVTKFLSMGSVVDNTKPLLEHGIGPDGCNILYGM